MDKPLSDAQKKKLQQLLVAARAAEQALEGFIDYLRDEHDAPANAGWVIESLDSGFTKREAAKEFTQNGAGAVKQRG